MYLHLGEKKVIRDSDIIGIFDIERCSVSKNTKEFLKNATKTERVINVSYQLPRSFIVTKENVYIAQISTATLAGRA